jgi:hypothetical protein
VLTPTHSNWPFSWCKTHFRFHITLTLRYCNVRSELSRARAHPPSETHSLPGSELPAGGPHWCNGSCPAWQQHVREHVTHVMCANNTTEYVRQTHPHSANPSCNPPWRDCSIPLWKPAKGLEVIVHHLISQVGWNDVISMCLSIYLCGYPKTCKPIILQLEVHEASHVQCIWRDNQCGRLAPTKMGLKVGSATSCVCICQHVLIRCPSGCKLEQSLF